MNATMNTPRANRFASLAALTTVAVLHAASASAASKAATPMFNDRAAAKAAEVPAQARTQSGVVGTLNPSVLSASSIELTLADGQVVTAKLQRVARDDAKATQSWIGTFDDAPGSILVLSKAKGVVSGFATYKDQTFEVRPATGNKHVLFAVDLKKVPTSKDGVVSTGTAGGGDALAVSDYGAGDSAATMAGAVVHDVLIFYTPAAVAAYGQATLEGNIQSAVQSAIQAYQNSAVNVTVNVVGLQQSPVSESGSGMPTTLNNFKNNATVRSLRDKLAADMVVLVSQDSDWCGYANLTITSMNGVTNTDAYAAVYTNCLSNQTLAHELGHLQGLDHNRENTTGTREYPYSYGYRLCVTNGFGDIMSYGCPGVSVPRIVSFSSPSVYYNGYATGISYEADPANAAEAARTLNNTAGKVANYRVGTTAVAPTAPAAPSSLATSGVSSASVALRWSDNSSNETGFKVERSADGVNYAEIATLGAGTTSFTDNAVSARTSYYYRARAYNSVGASAYSNTVSVTTPDVAPPPPAAPGSVVAQNNANGSAVVSWADASSNESGFEVRRETWNAKRNVWANATTVGTTAANVTSLVDVSGNGTYRYYVRAVNSGGASAYAGPSQVTISGAQARKGKSAKSGG